MGEGRRCRRVKRVSLAIALLAAMPALAQQATTNELVGGPTPGAKGAGQVGSGAVQLPAPGPSAARPVSPEGAATTPSGTLTSANPTPAAATQSSTTPAQSSRGGGGGGAATAGTVTGPGAITSGVGATSSVPHSASASNTGIGAVINTGTAAITGASGSSRTAASSGSLASGASSVSGTSPTGASGNNVTGAASAARAAPQILCLPSAATSSEAEPFLAGTDLSCSR